MAANMPSLKENPGTFIPLKVASSFLEFRRNGSTSLHQLPMFMSQWSTGGGGNIILRLKWIWSYCHTIRPRPLENLSGVGNGWIHSLGSVMLLYSQTCASPNTFCVPLSTFLLFPLVLRHSEHTEHKIIIPPSRKWAIWTSFNTFLACCHRDCITWLRCLQTREHFISRANCHFREVREM